MPKLRSLKTMEGREMAGARALWHATGTKVEDFGKPVICVANLSARSDLLPAMGE